MPGIDGRSGMAVFLHKMIDIRKAGFVSSLKRHPGLSHREVVEKKELVAGPRPDVTVYEGQIMVAAGVCDRSCWCDSSCMEKHFCIRTTMW